MVTIKPWGRTLLLQLQSTVNSFTAYTLTSATRGSPLAAAIALRTPSRHRLEHRCSRHLIKLTTLSHCVSCIVICRAQMRKYQTYITLSVKGIIRYVILRSTHNYPGPKADGRRGYWVLLSKHLNLLRRSDLIPMPHANLRNWQ